jgi:predicted DsbA family dithiol-disulfide isomerase
MQRLVRGKSDEVEVIWRNFPHLSDQSLDAAIASECARRANRFDPMHEMLFSVRDSLGLKTWTRIASRAGIPDTAAFASCLLDDTVLELVRQDSAAAEELGIQGVPGVLVDSFLFRGIPSFRYLRAYVRRAGSATR